MEDSEKKRLTWLLKYIKANPFPVKCLSGCQAQMVADLQETPNNSLKTQEEIDAEIQKIYYSAEDEQTFQYDSVVYYEFIDKEKLNQCIGIIYNDEDFNWVQPNNRPPHRFEAIAAHFGFKNLHITYSHTSRLEASLQDFLGNSTYNFIMV